MTAGYQGAGDLDLVFPDVSAADGWSDAWALAGDGPVTAGFFGLGWNTDGVLAPEALVDGVLHLYAFWGDQINP